MASTIMVEEPKTFVDIEPGVYPATVKSIEDADGSFGTQYKFIFVLDGQTDDDGKPIEPWGWASRKVNARTKLFQWATALRGTAPQVRTPFSPDSLVGRKCLLVLSRKETDDGPRVHIDNLLPPKQGAKAEEPLEDRCCVCSDPIALYSESGKAYCTDHDPRVAVME